MKRIIKIVLTVMLTVAIFTSLSSSALARCNKNTNDAGRWEDPMSPSRRIENMCNIAKKYHKAQKGVMILLNANPDDCSEAVKYANQQQSWHGDWFLWSDIKCDNGMKIFIK